MRGMVRGSVILFSAFMLLTGCQGNNGDIWGSFGDKSSSLKDEADVSYYRNDQLVATGNAQFREKNYGKAYALFKKAIWVFPQDPQAWLGFAASSDMIGRFDSSDKGYKQLAKMIGNSPVLYNNMGYSYMLRGELVTARKYLLKAYEMDPSNQVTANNLEMLKNSTQFAMR